jgi:hypothetical protein
LSPLKFIRLCSPQASNPAEVNYEQILYQTSQRLPLARSKADIFLCPAHETFNDVVRAPVRRQQTGQLPRLCFREGLWTQSYRTLTCPREYFILLSMRFAGYLNIGVSPQRIITRRHPPKCVVEYILRPGNAARSSVSTAVPP